MSKKSKTFKNVVLEDVLESKITILKTNDSINFRVDLQDGKWRNTLISNKTALEIATWILDEVSE